MIFYVENNININLSLTDKNNTDVKRYLVKLKYPIKNNLKVFAIIQEGLIHFCYKFNENNLI